MTDDDLLARAAAARTRAYVPYSGFPVGAAVLADGEVFDGANVENASYGLSVCAERTAVLRAVLDGARALEAVAVVTETSPPSPPCGMCLQTLAEFAPDPAQVRLLLGNPAGEVRRYVLAEMLPHGFSAADLGRTRGS